MPMPPIAGAHAARDIVADAVQRDGRWQGVGGHLLEDCQAGPIIAMPLPTAKQSVSKRLGY